MKIKNIKTANLKLTKLKLIKSKSYRNIKNNIIDLNQIELYLKKSLNIIYRYHVNNKTIVFVGIPDYIKKMFKPVLKKSRHVYLNENIWLNGLITNKVFIQKYIKKNRIYIPQIRKKPDLIVILDEKKEEKALKEANCLKIPVISINSNFLKNSITLYKVPGNFSFYDKKINNIFLLMIISILKKFILK